MEIQFKKLDPNAVIPRYQTEGSAGFDLVSLDTTVIPVGAVHMVRTGLAVEIPPGLMMNVVPRSGIAKKYGSYVANSPGVIDSDYRGEICVLVQAVHSALRIQAGERIAQGVMVRAPQFDIVEVVNLTETRRGAGGFGSTGRTA